MKSIIISGASSGIGAQTAKILSASKYKVHLLGRNLERLKNVQKELTNSSEIHCFDFTDPLALKNFSDTFLKENNKPLHGIIINAGSINRNSFFKTSFEEWDTQYKISVTSPLFLIKQLWNRIVEDKTKIITVASTLGLKPIENTSAYSAMKAAMINWTQSLAIELAPYKINVHCVCPGIVQTPIHNDTNENWKKNVSDLIPLGRPGLPEDIGQFIDFLMSERSSWITGGHHVIDGGLLNLK